MKAGTKSGGAALVQQRVGDLPLATKKDVCVSLQC